MDTTFPIEVAQVAAQEPEAARILIPRASKIKILLHAFPTFEVGGSQVRFAAIANHFGPRYRHLIVSMNGRTDCTERLAPNVSFEILDIAPPKKRTLRNFISLRRHLADLKPDVLITYNWGSIEWGLANLIPICRHIHIEDGFGPEEIRPGSVRRRSLFRRLVLSRGAEVVLPSQTLMQIASERWKLSSRTVSYIPNGIDCARFMVDPDENLTASFRQKPDDLVVGTVATLRSEKNLCRMIDAFAEVSAPRPVRLIIVGDGSERDSLKRHAVRIGLEDKIIFTGALANPGRILRAFDIFALSSDTEQMPFSVLEAMAAGLPIAAVDVGDVRAMLPSGNHPYVVRQTSSALTKAMSDLLNDTHARAEIGLANRAHVRRHFDQVQMFERYAALFDR